jgi:hypothetical protein
MGGILAKQPTTVITGQYASKFGIAQMVVGFNGAAMAGTTAACAVNLYTEIGRLMVPAGRRYALGAGAFAKLNEANGRIYANVFNDALSPGALIPGSLRIELHDPTDRPVLTLWEMRTDAQGLASTTPSEQPVLPHMSPSGSFNYSLVLKLLPDVAATFGAANSAFSISYTVATLSQVY